VKHAVNLLNENGEKTGSISFETEFVWIEDEVPVPEVKVEKLPAFPHSDINGKSMFRVTIEEASFESLNNNSNHFISFMYQQKN
jgi:hypothetical protein